VGALRNAAILAAGVALLTAPGSLASTAPASTALASADWGTYGFNVSRGGFNPYEKKIDSRSVHRLRQAWSFRLGSAIDTQPLVASNVPVRSAADMPG
jgi:glucose dehydrogenase